MNDKKGKNFYLNSILKLLSLGYPLNSKHKNSVAKKLKLSKQALNYYVKHLLDNNYIKKVGYGTYNVVKESYKAQVSTTWKESKKIRGHGFRIKVKIKSYSDKKNILRKKGIEFKIINSGAGTYPRIIVDDWKIWWGRKSLVFICGTGLSFYGETAKESYVNVMLEFRRVIAKFEKLTGVSFKVRGFYLASVFRNEYGITNNSLAKLYNVKHKRKLKVYDESGKQWLIIDNSFNLNELETVHSKTALPDNLKVQRWANQLKARGSSYDEFDVMRKEVVEKMNILLENDRVFLTALNNFMPDNKVVGEKVVSEPVNTDYIG